MIQIIDECVRKLLYDEVLDNTHGVMTELREALKVTAGGVGMLPQAEKKRLQVMLEPLISESIREALHKHELRITNEVIRHKNTILTACGVKLDESHAEINAANYAWNW